jgi:hypothetical protein
MIEPRKAMKEIKAEIIADSICNGHRITSMILTFPRFILAELNTHRMLSKNSASSRAIPFEKMVKMVEEDPFIPIAWQKDHKGMQGVEYITGAKEIQYRNSVWLGARDRMIRKAKTLNDKCSYPNNDFDSSYEYGGVTKQLCNRLLEPFMWHTVLVTATEWENFFKLRCPQYHTPVSGEGFYFRSKKDCIANHSDPDNLEKLQGMSIVDWQSINTSQAEIHMQALAEAMWDAMNESVPKELQPGMWHLPWQSTLDLQQLLNLNFITDVDQTPEGNLLDLMIKASTARCARLSYMTFDGEVDHAKDIELHDRLLKDHHYSPFEHCARAMDELEYDALVKTKPGEVSYVWEHGWAANFRGWISYRFLIENT